MKRLTYLVTAIYWQLSQSIVPCSHLPLRLEIFPCVYLVTGVLFLGDHFLFVLNKKRWHPFKYFHIISGVTVKWSVIFYKNKYDDIFRRFILFLSVCIDYRWIWEPLRTDWALELFIEKVYNFIPERLLKVH